MTTLHLTVARHGCVETLPQFFHLGLASAVLLTVPLEGGKAGFNSEGSLAVVHKYILMLSRMMRKIKPKVQNFWLWLRQLSTAFKIISLILIIFQMLHFTSIISSKNLTYETSLVVQEYQYWRLLSSAIAGYLLNPYSVIFFLGGLWVLFTTLPSVERRYSSIYVLVEWPKQILLVNLVSTVVFYPFLVFNILDSRMFFTGGIADTAVIFLFLDCGTDPNGTFNLFCFRCFLSKKYLPILILPGLFTFWQGHLFLRLFVLLFLFYQFGLRKKPIFAFSTALYIKLNSCIPLFIRNLQGWKDSQPVRQNLETVCESWRKEKEKVETDQSLISADSVEKERKKIRPKGQEQFKHHWINKEDPSPEHIPEMQKDQIDFEDVPEYKAAVQEEYEEKKYQTVQYHQRYEEQENRENIVQSQNSLMSKIAGQNTQPKDYRQIWRQKQDIDSEQIQPEKSEEIKQIQPEKSEEIKQNILEATPELILEAEEIRNKPQPVILVDLPKSQQKMQTPPIAQEKPSPKKQENKVVKAVSALEDDEQWS